MHKGYIFISGGVCSSLGKGVAAASIGALLESHNMRVCLIKIDPYLNVDAGSMNPFQHGEVYVTADGAETDLDLGNYGRFTSSPIDARNSITTGQVYQEVIRGEREGKYLGETVQVIPHITDCIKRRIRIFEEASRTDTGDAVDVVIVEIGGTVGDIESVPFIEAARQMMYEMTDVPVLSIHTTLVPRISNSELKTKPTQHSVKELREIGIQPHILICRSPESLEEPLRKKIALFTNVDAACVISAPDVDEIIYEVPAIFQRQGLDTIIMQKLGYGGGGRGSAAGGGTDGAGGAAGEPWWSACANTYARSSRTVTIAMVGKYIKHSDSYHSVEEALLHAAIANGAKLRVVKVDADNLLDDSTASADFAALERADGILIPGGFGIRGAAGMLHTIQYARENAIPFFGICMGMQLMAVEFARNVLGEADADSAEFNASAENAVVDILPDKKNEHRSGGTMRLGNEQVKLLSAEMQAMYGTDSIEERHRHRYEIMFPWIEKFTANGLIVSAVHPVSKLVEGLQWKDHPWGFSVQYHPEFTSRPTVPNPLFQNFIKAALK